jgi:hypothetical protein
MLPIIIYPHSAFNLSDGGITVQYYLASILDSLGVDVKICNVYDNNRENVIFNKFITFKKAISSKNIVIYCEGVIGNPLNSKHVVRWILSKLGLNVPYTYHLTWGSKELVYFFNSEIDLINYSNFKQLTALYVNPIFKDFKNRAATTCFITRKNYIQNPQILHSPDSFEITRQHTQNDYLEIFNKHTMVISYDTLSFLSTIATLCGCISVIYPTPGLSKREYFKTTCFHNYMVERELDSIYGIAYGVSQEEIEFSRRTLHLCRDQIEDIKQWFQKYIVSFLKDLQDWKANKNTLSNYLNATDKDMNLKFYRNYYKDLYHMTDRELIQHYNNYGKKEGRIICRKQLK